MLATNFFFFFYKNCIMKGLKPPKPSRETSKTWKCFDAGPVRKQWRLELMCESDGDYCGEESAL